MYVLEYLLYHLRPYGINTRITTEDEPDSKSLAKSAITTTTTTNKKVKRSIRSDIFKFSVIPHDI